MTNRMYGAEYQHMSKCLLYSSKKDTIHRSKEKKKEDTLSKAGLSHHNDPRPADEAELLLLQFCQTELHEVIPLSALPVGRAPHLQTSLYGKNNFRTYAF